MDDPASVILVLRAMAFAMVGTLLTLILFQPEQSSVGPFLFWTAPFLISFGLVVYRWMPLIFRAMARPQAYRLAVVGGAAFGYAWGYIVLLALGPWFLNFDFPVTLCWMVGGAVGMVGAVGLVAAERKPLWWVEGACTVLLPVSTVLCSIHVVPWMVGARVISLRCLVWQPGLEPTIIEDKFGVLTEEEKSRLRALRLGGTLFVNSAGASGEVGAPLSANILIMRHQVTQEAVLPVSWSAKTLILIQRPNRWEQVPAKGKTLPNSDFEMRAENSYTVVRVNMQREGVS